MRDPTIAIVGGESLLALELRDVLSGQAPDARVKLLGMETDGVTLTEQDGVAADFLRRLHEAYPLRRSVADNLRISAENAVSLALSLLAGEDAA